MKSVFLAFLVMISLKASAQLEPTPKIVNIVNFIRLLEPRDAAITQDVLYKTVVEQVKMMREHKLPGTFLLQYDALMDTRYQELLKALPRDSFEIGAWWEIPQPLVQNAGMKWRGRYPWDWHADVGFSTGYLPEERKKLIDVYMKDFKKIFGYYPKSVASWFIDAYSLNYMYEKYSIEASANCKDQYGTDGYTLWGGYWNQAYYPSKTNSYMPAQNASQQINVPIFRMLGSDPVRQYDTGLGNARQGVITLEPVYDFGGGDSAWVSWFLQSLVNDRSVGFNYTQAGQENSFTWASMKKGFELQIPLLQKLRDEGKLQVETMAASGAWFKKTYPVTPATSFSVEKDLDGSDKQTTWYNSRFYRANLIWENGSLRIRDMHLFDERIQSDYYQEPVTENECRFFTVPIIDGYLWSRDTTLAGARLMATRNGKPVLIKGGRMSILSNSNGELKIKWPLENFNANMIISFNENRMQFQWEGQQPENWYFEMKVAPGTSQQAFQISPTELKTQFEDHVYSVTAEKGMFRFPKANELWRAEAAKSGLILVLNKR